MEAKSFVSSASVSLGTSSLLRPIIFPQHLINNRRSQLGLPITVNPQRWNIGMIRHSNFSFCTRAAFRRNLEATGAPTSVPVRVARELQLAGHKYLDVRTPEEFSAGHAVGAINIPYMYRVGSGMTKNPKFLVEAATHFGKYDEIIVGCQLGKRSLMAAADLLAAGYTAVTDIAGGYAAWTQNGLPTEN